MSDRARFDFELILVSYHSREQLEGLLAGLPEDIPCAIVDNAKNADGLREFAAGRVATRYVDSGGGAGFARAANLGVQSSTFPYVVLVNPDTRPSLETLEAIVGDVRTDPGLISSSPLNVSADGRPELGVGGWEPSFLRAVVHSAGLHKLLPRKGLFARPAVGEPVQLDWVTGSCMAVDRARFLALGAFDERYYVYNEDMALGRTARSRGLRQRLRTELTMPHAVGGSGAPSTEMLRLRGASMRRYLLHRHSRLKATLIADVLGVGYVVRAIVYALLRRPQVAVQHRAYAEGVFSGRAWVAGVEVTNR